jgi:hypothetical protein
MQRFTSFVVFAEMRTGSNLLEANLNTLPGVVSHGEVFNRYILGKKDRTELFGISMEERDRDPRALLRKPHENTEGLPGFRFFHDHDLRILDDVLPDPSCAKIILTRNPLESFISWKIAQATDQWKLTNPKRLKTAKIRFNVPEFLQHLQDVQAFQLLVLNALQTTGQTAFYLDYDDLGSVEVMNGLAAFLGVEARLKSLDDTLKKQNPGPLEDKLENPEALAEAIAAIDVFNLGRTPVSSRDALPGCRPPSPQTPASCSSRSAPRQRPRSATGSPALAMWRKASNRNPSASGSASTPATAASPCCAIPCCVPMPPSVARS